MTDLIQVHWNCGSIDEARTVCRYLIQEGLAACANIIPWVESIYLWDNQLQTDQESKVIIKTRLDQFEAVQRVIVENSRYDLPEILYTRIDGGLQEYIDWAVEVSTSPL